MKLTLQRTLFEIINFLMALLLVIPLGVFIEQMCGLPLYRCCLIPCVAVLGFLIGRFSMTKPMQVSIALSVAGLAVSTIVAAALSLSIGRVLPTVLITLLTAFFSVFYFFSARKAGYTIYAPMAVSGILLHLLVLLFCTGLQWPERVGRFTSAVAIVFFLLTLFAFSAKGLRRSVHRGSGDRRVKYPAGMQMGNFLLVTGFILVAAFISNIYPLFRLFSAAFAVVIRIIIAIFAFISSLFDRRTVALGEETVEESIASVASEDNIMAYDPKGEATWVTTAVEVFAFICVLLFFLYAAYKLIRKLQSSGMQLPGFLRDLRDRFAPVADEDYVDENESLFDMKTMLSDVRGNVSGALKRFRERPQKIDDFPDDRMKVRFVFQQLLRRVRLRDQAAPSRTPNEIYAREYEGEQDFRQFMDYYNLARYTEDDLPADAGDLARSISKQKL